MRFGALLCLLLVSGCGFEPVEECFPNNCLLDAGVANRDGGLTDAGRVDAGSFDAGSTVDAGSVDAGSIDAGSIDAGSVDAAVDAGPVDAGPVDAGSMDAGCLGIVRPYTSSGRDVIHVEGLAGPLGTVDYTISGYSAGSWGVRGMQRFTSATVASPGAPAIQDTGLGVWASGTGVQLGVDYTGNNVNQSDTGTPFINFRISPGISCGAGLGQGSFQFTSFRAPTSPGSNPIEGLYEFRCPSAGIDVRGCFHYSP